MEVAALAAEGLTNDQIAERLYITKFAVKKHMHDIYTAMGYPSDREARGVQRVMLTIDFWRSYGQ